MGNFICGQKVVCIKEDNFCECCGDFHQGPKVDEIVTIAFITDDGWFSFQEYDQAMEYEAKNFRPLHYQFAENLLKNIEPIKKIT